MADSILSMTYGGISVWINDTEVHVTGNGTPVQDQARCRDRASMTHDQARLVATTILGALDRLEERGGEE